MLELSQVILAVPQLGEAKQRFEDLGFTVLDGGRHPGLGTANCIIPLGRDYLELLGVVDEREASRTAYGLASLRAAADGVAVARWALRTDDIETVAMEMGVDVESRTRVTPGGERITWRVGGLQDALLSPCHPFLMQWDDPCQFPGAIPVTHANGATGVGALHVVSPAPQEIQPWIDRSGAPVHLVTGDCGIAGLTVRLAGGGSLPLP